MSNLLRIFISVLALAGLIFTPSIAKADVETAAWLPTIRDSADLLTDIVISGTIHTNNGVPFPSGSKVTLFAYPASEVVDALKEGESVSVTPVAKALTGNQGTFELRVGDILDLARFASKDGIIDFEVRALHDTQVAPFSFSRRIHKDSKGATLSDPAFTIAPEPSRTTDSRKLQQSVVNIVSLAPNPAVEKLYGIVGGDSGPINKTDVCGETLVSNQGSQKVLVGTTYTTATNTSAKFTYANGASSNLGVGYSISGKVGTYSANGTTSRSSTTSLDFGTRSGSYEYSTYFRYGKYSQWCYPVGQPNAKNVYAYKVKANQFDGGTTVVSSSAPSATYCTPFAANTSLTRDTSAATSWTQGASLKSIIGINLSSQTGYTSSAKLTYYNTGSTNRQLCGTHGTPGSAPGRIVAKS